jgi:hypothetical protein
MAGDWGDGLSEAELLAASAFACAAGTADIAALTAKPSAENIEAEGWSVS